MRVKSSNRIIALLLVLMLTFTTLVACGPKESPANPEPNPPVTEPATPQPTPEPEPVLDPEVVLLDAAKKVMNNIPDNLYIMPADEAIALAEENPDAIFWVDMRSPEDYAKGHIKGAVNIPYSKTGELLEVLPKNKQIIFQCYSGQTSAQVTSLAQMLGFNALSFRGGMKFGWEPLALGEDSLETTENKLPEAQKPELSEEEQIVWDAVKAYFSDSNYIISPEDLNNLVKENPDAITVLDIRSAEDFAKGHIESAINIPYKEVGNNIETIAKNRPVYVTCYTGQTAGITIGALRVLGYNAISLNRGMTGWTGANLPVVTE